MLDLIFRLGASLVPVLLFLLILVYLDSYRMVRVRHVLVAVLVGCVAALACLLANELLAEALNVRPRVYVRYGAPFVEELAKAIFVAWLISRRHVGFLVDSAIAGFAVGTGFALIENTWYVGTLGDASVIVWIVRGFGTAIMHGGMTAMYAVVSKTLHDRDPGAGWGVYIPGLFLAVVIHSAYNHFILPPVAETILLHLTLPFILLFVFYRSERATRRWLGDRMDVDADLLAMINTGRTLETSLGRYVETMRENFPPEMVVDIMCYLRVHTELAVCAKGLLMMREAGFDARPPAGTRERFEELRALERSLGRTGRLAVMPLLHSTPRETWQLRMLERMVR